MATLRLYLDEDAMRGSFVSALRASNVDVLTVSEANRKSYSDEAQLLWATSEERVIYSFNVQDFSRLHRDFLQKNLHHAGIIAVPRQRYSVGEQLRGLLKVMECLSTEEMVDQLIFLSNYINTP
jgi:hypothetical protein